MPSRESVPLEDAEVEVTVNGVHPDAEKLRGLPYG